MLILGIESSCDETAASVVKDCTETLSSVIASQAAEHGLYGGVVPELASRRHCENILAVVQQALADAHVTVEDLDGIAVTHTPGLIGALLVGVNFAKGLAMAADKPLIPVHHLTGHIAANYLAHPQLKPPYLCLVVSGGHTLLCEVKSHTEYEIIGTTRDDAAGECFDKCARVLGYPYPGGVHIDRAAQQGDSTKYVLPRPKVAGSELDCSFSGLKTAVINMVHHAEQKGETIDTASMAASLQHTVSEILAEKTLLAAKQTGYTTIAMAGGVSANSGLRSAMERMCRKHGYALYMPPLSLCGDNAAMIACQGSYNYLAGVRADESLNAYASSKLSIAAAKGTAIL
ncbi:MAG: tRNA (adenosine(37)-N6)-threonylcarbamoyltransferase complex transferase subunit TsaD [Oscillospiraceae bacterium]|nr:tRNA (adenosine(37)-N6)-threonylcarbamoyltransferase complex transferase subunit TsaD [Oscillospiraceae bacterium]